MLNLPRGNEVDPGQHCPGTTNHHVNAGNACPGAITTRGSSGSCEHAPSFFSNLIGMLLSFLQGFLILKELLSLRSWIDAIMGQHENCPKQHLEI